jgi:hypothetical protein
MPIGTHSDAALGLTVVVWDGEVDDHDIRDHVRRLGSGTGWDRHGRILTDLTTVTSKPDPQALARAVQRFDESLGARGTGAKWAIVATGLYWDALGFSKDADVAPTTVVFEDAGLAATWLGVDAERARAITSEIRRGLRRAADDSP